MHGSGCCERRPLRPGAAAASSATTSAAATSFRTQACPPLASRHRALPLPAKLIGALFTTALLTATESPRLMPG